MWWCKVHYFQGMSVKEFIAIAEEYSRGKSVKKDRLPTIWEVHEGPPAMPTTEYTPWKGYKERLPIIWEVEEETLLPATRRKRAKNVNLPIIWEVDEAPESLTGGKNDGSMTCYC